MLKISKKPKIKKLLLTELIIVTLTSIVKRQTAADTQQTSLKFALTIENQTKGGVSSNLLKQGGGVIFPNLSDFIYVHSESALLFPFSLAEHNKDDLFVKISIYFQNNHFRDLKNES